MDACGQGEGGVVSCGCHIWMAPKEELERGLAFQTGPRPSTGLIRHCIRAKKKQTK